MVYYKNKAVREQEFTLLEVAISWGICNELNTNWFDYYVSLLLEENVATQSNLCHQQIRETFSCIELIGSTQPEGLNQITSWSFDRTVCYK